MTKLEHGVEENSLDSLFEQEEQNAIVRSLWQIEVWRLRSMMEKYPTLKNSWQTFLTTYNICLSNEIKEDYDTDY
jgi:hypothetical protein